MKLPQELAPRAIADYGRFTAAAEYHRRQGREVPAVIQKQLSALDNLFLATFNQQQLQALAPLIAESTMNAHGEVAATERNYEAFQRVQAANEQQAFGDTIARNNTDHATVPGGLTQIEWQRIKEGKTIKRGAEQVQIDPRMLDAATQQATKHLDVRGRGFTAKEWTQKLDALEGSVRMRGWAGRVRELGLKDSPELEKAADRHKMESIAAHFAPQSTEKTLTPHERDSTKALIAENVLKDRIANMKGEKDAQEIAEPEGYTAARKVAEEDPEGRRGDVARAVLSHWEDEPTEDHEYAD